MNATLTKLLKPLASLKLTVGLLLISCVLVLAGTTAQRDMGIQDVQHEFFHSWIAKIQFHYFQPTPKPGHSYIGGWLPLPGGYTLIFLLLANLLAAHTIRFKLRMNRIGVILIHLGLILLLVGELVTSLCAVESRMTLNVGGSSNFAEDIRESELAVIDHSPADHDNVTVVAQNLLERGTHGTLIHNPQLPFDVKVDRFYENSRLRGPVERGPDVERLADQGDGHIFGLTGIPRFSGTEAESVDIPSGFVTLIKNGRSLGTYLVSVFLDKPQQVTVDGKTYDLALRFRRYYKPYTIHLNKFTHDVFLGTETARNFASEIRLTDPSRHVDREVKIWMNHPLRYAGETFYQQSFANQDRTSILQVVHNPGWLMPYIACAIGALGMVIHFGINLVGFLRRKFAATGGAVGAAAAQARSAGARNSNKGKRGKSAADDSYRLEPPARWPGILIPVVAVAICAIYVVGQIMPPPAPAGYNWEAFGRLPISFEGRVQPLDSLARNSLSIVCGHQVVFDEKGERTNIPPVQWLLEVMTRTGKWADYKTVQINHPQIKDMLGLKEADRYFSWSDIFSKQDNPRKLDEQANLAAQVPDKQRDAFQNGIIELHQHLGVYLRLFQVDAIATQYDLMTHPEQVRSMFQRVSEAIATVDPQLMSRLQANQGQDLHAQFQQALMKLDFNKLTPEQKQAVVEFMDQSDRTSLLRRLGPNEDLYLTAPMKSGDKWQPLAQAVRDPNGQAPEAAAAFLRIVNDYERQSPGDFNADVAAYQAKLQTALPTATDKVDYEAFFNRFDPFTICMVFYIAVFVLAICSWMGWTRPLWRTAFSLLLLTLTVHTFGLASRIYISGRPPVTNLYSSAVFIAWGIVVLSALLELVFRNGIALVAASTAGFLSLLVAAGLASTEGDTMKQLQAVLDTNFWLATHVVCVTLGYTSTFLAGLLAILYILRGVFSSSITKESMKDHAKMVYGIVCFAMLFSFVGTILGGIWADQSWGRFWGWDPKENGAVLIVLWNALILHARWGGLVKDRGVMVLAVLGNIVTAWSWFGTNMLGIGLHSYGFMQSAQFWLIAFMGSQVLLAAIGLIPQTHWASMAIPNSREEK